MIAGKLIIAKRFATIEAEVAVTSKEEFVLKRRIGEYVVNFAVAGNDARQPEHLLNTAAIQPAAHLEDGCLLYTSPSPRDRTRSRMPSSA